MQNPYRFLLPLVIVFLFFVFFIFVFSPTLDKYNISSSVLLGANVLFFVISMISFFIQRKGMLNKNPHVFVRSVTGGMMVKMLFCIIAVIAYVYYSGTHFNKRAVFISLFFYLAYLGVEVFVVMKMNKKHNA